MLLLPAAYMHGDGRVLPQHTADSQSLGQLLRPAGIHEEGLPDAMAQPVSYKACVTPVLGSLAQLRGPGTLRVEVCHTPHSECARARRQVTSTHASVQRRGLSLPCPATGIDLMHLRESDLRCPVPLQVLLLLARVANLPRAGVRIFRELSLDDFVMELNPVASSTAQAEGFACLLDSCRGFCFDLTGTARCLAGRLWVLLTVVEHWGHCEAAWYTIMKDRWPPLNFMQAALSQHACS